MSLKHVTVIVFAGAYQVAAKRVQKLKAFRYIAEMPRRIGDSATLFLTAYGRQQLTRMAEVGNREPPTYFRRRTVLKRMTLSHELEVMDAKAAILPALRKQTMWSLREFTTWSTLSQFRVDHLNGTQTTVKPDGFLSLINGYGNIADFFLEIDRSNETQAILTAKCRAYRSHYSSGNFAVRAGHPRSAYRSHPFRVLVIVPSDERRNNLASQLCSLDRPIHSQVWLTTRTELLADPLGAIWICPLDYANATINTAYAPSTDPIRALQYRTAPDRERLVAKQIRKRRLLD